MFFLSLATKSIFDEPVNKSNLKSVLERQKSLIFSLGDRSINNYTDKNINSHVINCLNIGLVQSNESESKNKSKISKLRERGLSDEEIADLLDIPLEVIKKTESVENQG